MDGNNDAQRPFHLFLFGGPRLLKEGRPCPLSPDQGAFLGLLYGNENEEVGKGEIISKFWPNDDPRAARHRLSQLIYSLKRKVGSPDLFVSAGEFILGSEGLVASDLREFEAALGELRLSHCSQLLARGFLCQVRDSSPPKVCSWIEGRERVFHSRLEGEAIAQLEDCTSKADWGGALRAAEVLSSLDPLNEEVLRKLMKAKARAGRRVEAEAAFEEYTLRRRTALGRGFEPTEETRELLRQIRAEEEIGPPKNLLARPQGRREPLLVGRDAEHALLRRSVLEPPDGAFRGILVTGEAGIGKTRLIRESLLGIGLEGQEVFWASQAELERSIPLNPLIEAMRKPRVGDTLALLDDPWRAVLYGVMPGHFRGNGRIPQAPEIGPKSVPRRLHEAFDQILLKLIQEGPVILVLENLQWADQTTLSVLEFLFRRWDQGKLQAVFSLRSDEIQRNSALSSFLETLRIHEDFLEIPLEDLSPSDSKTLIRDLSDHPFSDDEVRHLQSLAGGNPFFLIELTLEYLTGRVNRPAGPDRALSIPVSIRQVLERRLSQLSPAAETVLGVLAVHSKALRVEQLAKVADLPTWQCMNGLDQLEGFRLVHCDGTEISAGHELIRKTVYQSLTSSRRAWLHGRLGTHLRESTEDPPPDELAIHFHSAGEDELALQYAREAAEKAEASGAIAEALVFLDIARGHSKAPAEVATLIQKMGRLNYLTQDHQKAAPLLEVAAQRLRQEGMTAEALSAEVDRVDSLGQSGLLPLRERMAELERIKKEARANGHWEIFMKALDVAIHLADHSGDFQGVQEVLNEVRTNSDRGPLEAKCRARAILALDVYFGDPAEGLRAAREAVQIGFATGKVEVELRALNRLIVVLLYQGLLHTNEGKTAFREAEQRFSRCGDLIHKFFIRLNRAVGHLEVGELAQASASFPAAEAVIRGTEPGDLLARFLINKGELELEQNENQAARRSFSEASRLVSDSSPNFFRTISTAGVGLCALREGDLTTAKKLESEMPTLPRHWTFDPSVVTSFKVALLRMRGDLKTADHFLEDVAAGIRDRFVTTWVKLNIRRVNILRKVSPSVAKTVAAETLEKAVDLGLSVRIRQLEGLLDRI